MEDKKLKWECKNNNSGNGWKCFGKYMKTAILTALLLLIFISAIYSHEVVAVDYVVCTSDYGNRINAIDTKSLIKCVNKYLILGYTPQGGITYNGNYRIFHQAMVKYAEVKK